MGIGHFFNFWKYLLKWFDVEQYIYICIYMRVCVCVYIYMYIYVYIYIYIYVCMYIKYVYIYMHTYRISQNYVNNFDFLLHVYITHGCQTHIGAQQRHQITQGQNKRCNIKHSSWYVHQGTELYWWLLVFVHQLC